MAALSRWRAGFALAAGAAALAAGGVAAGLELERRIVGKRLLRLPPDNEPFFQLRADGPKVLTPDGVGLHTQIDDPAVVGSAGGPELTIVFVHGYALNLDCWHFQRKHFRARQADPGDPELKRARLVFYDQRSHGRSTRAVPDNCRIPRLADDLAQLLDEIVGSGRVILVGHSMGGMAIMHLARIRPDWFDARSDAAIRVIGAALIATSAGEMADYSPIRGIPGRAFARIAPPLLATLNRVPNLVERGRRASSDLGWVATKQWSFGRRDVPASYVEFMARMLADTPLSVVADFYPAFAELDESAAMPVLAQIETAVVGGADDLLTPVRHTEQIIDWLPSARSLILESCGHMGIIEWHRLINPVLDDLVTRSVRSGA